MQQIEVTAGGIETTADAGGNTAQSVSTTLNVDGTAIGEGDVAVHFRCVDVLGDKGEYAVGANTQT